MPFLDLPPELQTRILSHLVTSFGPSSIHRVLSVCKQLYSIALPLSVCIYRNTPPLYLGGGDCSASRNAAFLSYILIAKPQLAKHVKAVIVGGTRSSEADPHPDDSQSNFSTAAELAVYEERIRAALRPVTSNNEDNTLRCDQWIEDLRRGFSDAQLALISLVCPNIRLIFFEQPRQPRSFHFLLEMAPILTRLPDQDLRPLSKLEHVYYEPQTSKPKDTMFWTHAKLLMGLPRLRIYEAVHINAASMQEGDFGQIPRRSSSLQEIFLHQSKCTPVMLKSMLGACKCLTKLDLAYYFSKEPGSKSISAREVLDALLPHANTLTHLRLILKRPMTKWWLAPDESTYMGSRLRQLTELRNLVVEMDCLTSIYTGLPELHGAPRLVECLPDKLEYLQIQSSSYIVPVQAAELLRVIEKGDCFKTLRRIRFIFDEVTIKDEECSISLNSPSTALEIFFHWHPQHFFGMGPSLHVPERKMRTICSRIYAEDYRKAWLRFRSIVSSRNLKSEIKSFQYKAAGIANDPLEPECWAWLADSGFN